MSEIKAVFDSQIQEIRLSEKNTKERVDKAEQIKTGTEQLRLQRKMISPLKY